MYMADSINYCYKIKMDVLLCVCKYILIPVWCANIFFSTFENELILQASNVDPVRRRHDRIASE